MNFSGDVVTKWLQHSGENRYMELMEEFKFIDNHGAEWTAPAGHRINGASIPKIIWSSVGSPFVGDYRRASVVHDVECDLKRKPHKEVHRMFYDAMICDGVTPFRAKYMYQAARIFGPKWDNSGKVLKSNLSGNSAIDLSFLNQHLELKIDELEAKLDEILGEEN